MAFRTSENPCRFANKETRKLQAAAADGAGCSNRPAGRLPERGHLLDKPRAEEAVDAVIFGEMARQRAQIAVVR